jgi:hypothetical protein
MAAKQTTARRVLGSIGRGIGATARFVGEVANSVAEQQARVAKRKAERSVGIDGYRACLADAMTKIERQPYYGPAEVALHQALITALGDYVPPPVIDG